MRWISTTTMCRDRGTYFTDEEMSFGNGEFTPNLGGLVSCADTLGEDIGDSGLSTRWRNWTITHLDHCGQLWRPARYPSTIMGGLSLVFANPNQPWASGIPCYEQWRLVTPKSGRADFGHHGRLGSNRITRGSGLIRNLQRRGETPTIFAWYRWDVIAGTKWSRLGIGSFLHRVDNFMSNTFPKVSAQENESTENLVVTRHSQLHLLVVKYVLYLSH